MGQPDAGALHLPAAGLAPQMGGDLVDVGDAGGAQRVALGEQPAGDVHRNAPAQGHVAVVDQPAGAAVPAQAEVLVVQDLCGGEAVVQFHQVHVVRTEAGHLVGGGRGLAGAGVDVRHHQIALLPRVRGEHRSAHLDGPFHQPQLPGLPLRRDHRRGGAVDVHGTHELGVRVGDHLGVHHRLEGRLDLVHRLGIHGGVVVVLHGHLGELLEGGAVGAAVFHARLREHRWHGAGTEQPLLGDALAAASAAEQPLAHLLHAHREHQVVEFRLHRRPRLPEDGGAGGAGVGDVHHRNAGLPDLLQDALAHHAARLAEIAAVEGLHVLDGEAAVVQRQQRRFGADLRNRLVREPSELDHVYANDVCVCHGSAAPGRRPGRRLLVEASAVATMGSKRAGRSRRGRRCRPRPCALGRRRTPPPPACRRESRRGPAPR